MSPQNWFDQGGRNYAAHRPDYPAALASFLASSCSARALAIDVGCGNGQLTCLLAPHFDAVLGMDPSADQIANAAPAAGVSYQQASAEQLPLADASADLIAVAQAAHWFDLPAFYAEVRRVAAPGAVLALVSYGTPQLEADLQPRFARFYGTDMGSYWPAERRLVDSGYADLAFPFDEFAYPALAIERDWNLAETLGYFSTWSAVRRAREAGQQALLQDYADELATHWGDPQQRRAIHWPINMRIGRV
ncbi:TPA: class I SAM-dependent methyltransferase [Stenotrophomonas maltophilia]|nr:class I SAM-dependent methyltransferase [Stenotrophomonas maltophilia]